MATSSNTDTKIEEQKVVNEIEDMKEIPSKNDNGHEENGDEETECGFCLFMKGGGCKDAFIAWEKCVEEADRNKEDIVDKCFEVTSLLRKCMDAHSDYYEIILRAEKSMEEEAAQELAKESSSSSTETKVSKVASPGVLPSSKDK